MLNRFVGIIVIISLLACNLSRFFVYAEFSANQKYIAENFCVNKNRPWLHCNGHCYFMKKVQQAEENEKKQAAQNSLNRLSVSFFQQLYTVNFAAPAGFETMPNRFPAYPYQYKSHYIDAIFQPPKPLV